MKNFSFPVFVEKTFLALLLALVFLLPIVFGGPGLVWNSFTLPKVVLFQSLVLALFFLGGLKLFSSSEVFLVRNRYFFFFFFFLLFSWFLSSIIAPNPELSFWGRYDRLQGFFSFLGYGLLFLLLIFFLKKKHIKKILWVIAFSSFFVCIYGVLQYLGLDPIVWAEKGRIFSSLGQPNFLAHYLVMVLPVSFFLFWFSSGKRERVFLSLLVLLQLSCLLFTLSRAGWLAFLGGVLFFFLILPAVKGAKKLLSLSLVIGAILLLILAGHIFTGISSSESKAFEEETIWQRLGSVVSFDQGSSQMRLYYWQASWQEFKETSVTRKVFGYGPDSLADIFAGHYEKDWGVNESINTYPNRAHNFFLDTLLSFGILGVLSSLLFFGFIFFRSFQYLYFKRGDQGAEYWLVLTLVTTFLVYLINNFFSFSTVTTFVYFYLFLAILVILVFSERKKTEIKTSPLFKKTVSAFLLVLAFLFIYYFNLDFLKADHNYMKARLAMVEEGVDDKERCFRAINKIDSAIQLNPIHDYYRIEYLRHSSNCFPAFSITRGELLQNVLAEVNFLSQKEGYYNLDLYMARSYFLLSSIDPKYYQEAENIYRRLLEFNPYLVLPYKDLARLKLRQEETEAAADLVHKGLEKIPSPEDPRLNKEHRSEVEQELLYLYELLLEIYSIQDKTAQAEELKSLIKDLREP